MSDETTFQGLIPSISIDALLAARDQAVDAIDTMREEYAAATVSLGRFGVSPPTIAIEFGGNTHRDIMDPRYDEARRREIDRLVWMNLFRLTNIDTLMDSRSRRDLFEKLNKSQAWYSENSKDGDDLPPLTRENIEATFEALHGQQHEFFANSVEEVFRSLSWDHKSNAPNGLGASGKPMIVNDAFYPWSRAMQGETVSLSGNSSLHDLERVLHLIDGEPAPINGLGVGSLGYIPYGVWVDVPAMNGGSYMRVKVFRKGTCHVDVYDKELLRRMNKIMADRYPNRIPESAQSKNSRSQYGAPRRKPEDVKARGKKAAQAFYTPEPLADKMIRAALQRGYTGESLGGLRILEPSAGEGALAKAAQRKGADDIVCVENDTNALWKLESLDGIEIRAEDFLAMTPDPSFDLVIMNPPFSRTREVEHVMHAWEFLKPGGIMVAIMSVAAAYRTDTLYRKFRDWLEANPDTLGKMVRNETHAFAESGTHVQTVMFVRRKPEGQTVPPREPRPSSSVLRRSQNSAG